MAVSLPADLSGDGGCLKRTLRIALPNAQKVADGAIVAVHFKASLADGTLLRDSRSDAPLEVRVGAQPSDTVPGWDLALPKMAVGEVVELQCTPAYAYGEAGAPPLIPPNADMLFELEIMSVRDLRDSHNPEEVDFLARYNELQEKRSLRKRSTDEIQQPRVKPKSPQRKASTQSGKSTARRGPSGVTPSGETPPSTGNVTARRNQAWVPDRLELRGQHAAGYTWRENDEWMEVTFALPEDAHKNAIDCTIRRSSVELFYDGQSLLDGELTARVDLEGSAWSFESNDDTTSLPTVNLMLMKLERELWGYVLLEERLEAEAELVPVKDGPADDSEPAASSLQKPGVEWM
ncbi:MAG: hypothetical protein SGPRY_007523 [Prymnesium sp.]